MTTRAWDAIKRIRNTATTHTTGAGVTLPAALNEGPSNDGLVHRYVEDCKLKNGEDIDFAQLKKLLPYHRQTIDALERFDVARRHSAETLNYGFPPEVLKALNLKAVEIEGEGAASTEPINRIVEHLTARKEELEEKQRFLTEVKISDLMEENPQWTAQIQDDLANKYYL